MSHHGSLPPVVLDLKVQISRAGHDEGAGGDGTQGFFEVAVVQLIDTDVGVLPGPDMRQQVVWVAFEVVALPHRYQIVFQRGTFCLTPQFLTVESLRHRPPGIDPAHGTQPALRKAIEASVLKMGISRQCGLHAFEKNLVVRRSLRRAAQHRQPLNTVGKQGGPVVGLNAAHGPTGSHDQFFHTKHMPQHLALDTHVVSDGEVRPAIAIGWRRSVAR